MSPEFFISAARHCRNTSLLPWGKHHRGIIIIGKHHRGIIIVIIIAIIIVVTSSPPSQGAAQQQHHRCVIAIAVRAECSSNRCSARQHGSRNILAASAGRVSPRRYSLSGIPPRRFVPFGIKRGRCCGQPCRPLDLPWQFRCHRSTSTRTTVFVCLKTF